MALVGVVLVDDEQGVRAEERLGSEDPSPMRPKNRIFVIPP